MNSLITKLLIATFSLFHVTLAQGTCGENDFFRCQDCSTLLNCNGEQQTVITCADNEICVETMQGSALVGGCYSQTEQQNADCACPGETTFIGDTYNPSKYYMCLTSGDRTTLECPTGEVFLAGSFSDPCVELTSTSTSTSTTTTSTTTDVPPDFCTGKDFGFYDADQCDYFFACVGQDAPLKQECATGESYSVNQGKCVSNTVLTAAFTCPGAPSSGAFADNLTCDIFHICFEGTEIGNPVSCEEGQTFDETSMSCVADGTCVSERCPLPA